MLLHDLDKVLEVVAFIQATELGHHRFPRHWRRARLDYPLYPAIIRSSAEFSDVSRWSVFGSLATLVVIVLSLWWFSSWVGVIRLLRCSAFDVRLFVVRLSPYIRSPRFSKVVRVFRQLTSGSKQRASGIARQALVSPVQQSTQRGSLFNGEVAERLFLQSAPLLLDRRPQVPALIGHEDS